LRESPAARAFRTPPKTAPTGCRINRRNPPQRSGRCRRCRPAGTHPEPPR
jgi:hypothetical protein